jgi:hypothetical protein
VYPEAKESTDGGPASGVGYIYIISEQSHGYNTGFYKIGRTGDLQERIEELQTGNAQLLCPYGSLTVNDMAAAERAAHAAVSQYRATDGGGIEWFYVPLDNFQEFVRLAGQAIAPYVLQHYN